MIQRIRHEIVKGFPLIGRGLTLVWRAARLWTLAWAVLLLIQGLIPAAQVYLIKVTVDVMASGTALGTTGLAVSGAIPKIALIGLLWIFSLLISSLIRWVRAAQS